MDSNQLKCCIALNETTKCLNKRLTCNDRAFINAISKCISDEQTLQELFMDNNIYVCSKHITWRLEEIIRSKQVDTFIDYATFKTCNKCSKYKMEKDYMAGYEICRKCCMKEIEEKDKMIYRKMNIIKKCAVDNCNNKSLHHNNSIHADILTYFKILTPYYDCCLQHQIDGWRKELFQLGRKPCNNYMKGCRNTFGFKDKKKVCDECKNNTNININIDENLLKTILQCKYCNDVLTEDQFIDNNCCIRCNNYRNKKLSNMTYAEYLEISKLDYSKVNIDNSINNPINNIDVTDVTNVTDVTDDMEMLDMIQTIATEKKMKLKDNNRKYKIDSKHE